MGAKSINNKFLLDASSHDFKSYESLPMAVYVANHEGDIVRANKTALNFFKIPYLSSKSNIEEFYVDRRQRKGLLNKLERLENRGWVSNETLLFKIAGKYKSVSFFSQIYKDKKGKLLGILCLTFKITEFERFKGLESYIPGGFFQISSKQELIYANNEFMKIMGYDEQGDFKLPVPATSFFEHKLDFEEIVQKLEGSSESLELEKITLKRKDGSSILTNIYIVPNHDVDGKLIGSKGLIKDITIEYIYDFVPIGLYMLDLKDGKKIITWANKTFEEVHKDPDKKNEQIIGRNVTDFYPNPADHTKLEQTIAEEETHNRPLLGYDQTLKNGKKIILNTRQIRNSKNELEARIGSIFDVTENVNKWTSEIKKEIGGFLHTYSSMLVFFDKSFLNFAKSIGGDFFYNNKIKITAVEEKLKGNIIEFEKEISGILKKNNNQNFIEKITTYRIKALMRRMSEKEGYRLKTQAAWFREIVLNLSGYLLNPPTKKYLEKIGSNLISKISKIIRFSNLASMHHARVEIETMMKEIELMKEFIATGKFSFGKKKQIDIIEVMDEVTESLGEYSRSQQVEIRKDYKAKTSMSFYGNRHQLKIAFYNVIHNAIKYSFNRSYGKYGDLNLPWVAISVKKSVLNEIEIKVQNRGVGIDQKMEIDNHRIFEFGQRGIHSRDKGRLGSGIGLFHTKKVIEFHGGKIKITSTPTKDKIQKEHSVPYLTTVTINLN